MSEICSKLTIKTPKQRQLRRSGVFVVNFEQILYCSAVSIADFQQVNAGWVRAQITADQRKLLIIYVKVSHENM